MGTLEDGIRELIKESNMSLAKFAREVGIPEHTLYSALNNGLSGSSMMTAMPIISALGLSPSEAANGRFAFAPDPPSSVDVPLYGSISAGKPIEPSEAEGSFPVPAQLHRAYPRAFFLRVEGESMNRILPNGCLALVDPRTRVDVSGDVYAVTVGDQTATVKRVRLLENGLELQPYSDDPTFRSLIFDRADSSAPSVRVVGKVVWHCPPVEWSYRLTS